MSSPERRGLMKWKTWKGEKILWHSWEKRIASGCLWNILCSKRVHLLTWWVEWPAVGEREWFQAISHGPWNCKSFPSGGMTPKNLHLFHLLNIEWLLVMRGVPSPPMEGPPMLGLPKVSDAVLKGTSGPEFSPTRNPSESNYPPHLYSEVWFCLSDPLSPNTSVTSRMWCGMSLISLPAKILGFMAQDLFS